MVHKLKTFNRFNMLHSHPQDSNFVKFAHYTTHGYQFGEFSHILRLFVSSFLLNKTVNCPINTISKNKQTI